MTNIITHLMQFKSNQIKTLLLNNNQHRAYSTIISFLVTQKQVAADNKVQTRRGRDPARYMYMYDIVRVGLPSFTMKLPNNELYGKLADMSTLAFKTVDVSVAGVYNCNDVDNDERAELTACY